MSVLTVVGRAMSAAVLLLGLALPGESAGAAPAVRPGSAAAPMSVVAAAISGDGRYLAYVLDAGPPPAGGSDQPTRFLYRRDLITGAVVAVLPDQNPMIGTTALSTDGRLLGSAGWSGEQQLHALLADVPAGTVADLSIELSDLDIASPVAMAGAGRYAVYAEVSQFLGTLLPAEIYRYDLRTGISRLVSEGPAGIADAWSADATVDRDGGFVAFTSAADNLVDGDTNGLPDVFAVNLGTNVVQLVSRGRGGPANGASAAGGISGDGRLIPYTSAASDIVDGDTNGVPDVFVHDRRNGRDQIISRGPAGPANGPSTAAGISADGRYVLFTSAASNLVTGDTNGVPDAFVRDLRNGHLRRVSLTAAGREATGAATARSISADGRLAAFTTANSTGTALYVYNLATGATAPIPL